MNLSAIASFVKKMASCLVVLFLLTAACVFIMRVSIGGSFFQTMLLAALPSGILFLYLFLKKGKNKKRTAIIVGTILTVIIVIILGADRIFQPVFRSPQDIINSINSGAGDVLTLQKTLEVSGNSQVLEVAPTATNQDVNGNALCATMLSIMHKSEEKVWLDSVTDWISGPDFNVSVWWNVDGSSTEINPGGYKNFRSTKNVKLESIHTVQNGQTQIYNCS